jgi:hypothetical protein
MAQIVLGLGTSHSPQLSIPAEYWRERGEEDRRNPWLYALDDGRHVSYDELLPMAPAGIEKELLPDVMRRRHEANQRGIDRVAEAIETVSPDVLVMVGDDQQELFHDDNMPALCVYWGQHIPYVPRHGSGTSALVGQLYPPSPMSYEGAPDLALHIIGSFMEQGVDVAHSRQIAEGGSISHSLSFVYARILRGRSIPVVPVLQNTYFPPNQPTPRRSYEFGVALRNAIERWTPNTRVAVLASGGFSHFVVDEEIDRRALKALEEKDVEALTALPRERLQSGTSEIRNWITVAGAVQHLEMEVFDYVPCYRSPAGTGCAMAFAQWK